MLLALQVLVTWSRRCLGFSVAVGFGSGLSDLLEAFKQLIFHSPMNSVLHSFALLERIPQTYFLGMRKDLAGTIFGYHALIHYWLMPAFRSSCLFIAHMAM